MARYDVTIQDTPTEDNATGLKSVVAYADRDSDVITYIKDFYGDGVIIIDFEEIVPA